MSVQAFDIIFSGNLSNLFSEGFPSRTSITCLEVCEDFLYLGCRDGNLIKCGFKRSSTSSEQPVVITKASYLYSSNSSVVQIKAISALTQLLVLFDDTLVVLDLETLTLVKTLKFKNVGCFCLNQNPITEDPFTVEICIATKKKILYVHLSTEKIKIIKEICTNLTPTTLVMDGAHVCFAMGSEYCMVDVFSGEIQELFTIDTPDQPPIIYKVSKGEFLLTGPGGLGVFVLSQGFSEKPPINFPSVVSAITFRHPYIIAVYKQGICFYSIIDQQCKQTIAIDHVRCVVNGDGQVFASTKIDLFALLPISWETQLEKLLAENRVEEALQLAENAHISSNHREKHNQTLRDLEQKVALQRFSSGHFQDAMEMFETCNIDPREVISLDIKQMFPDEETRNRSGIVILDFLQRWRVKSLTPDQKHAVDKALLKHLAKSDSDGSQLLDFIVDCDTEWDETRSILETYKRFHCLATFCAAKLQWEEAFSIWDRLIKKDIEDLHFPGYPYVAEQLAKSQDVALVWRFSGDILKIDEEIGATIFTSQSLSFIKPRAVIDFLRNYHRSLRIFLEFLIREKNDEDESVHTQLAFIYIDEITNSDVDCGSPYYRMTVNKLRSLLRTSKKLDLSKLSNTLNSPSFPHEHAIVCGRLGQHSIAINTFINKLKDFEAAEEYCACVDDPKAWNCLLTACVSETHAHKFDWVSDLLRRRPQQFDVPSALLCLPDNTRFNLVSTFVNFAVRESLHEKRMKSVERALHQMDNMANRFKLKKMQNVIVTVNPSSFCCICKKRFEIKEGFVRFPNGVVTHTKCAPNRTVCPLTGHLFNLEIYS